MGADYGGEAGEHLVHVAFNVVFEVPGDDKNDVFLIVFGIYLQIMLVGHLNKLHYLSIMRECEINIMQDLPINLFKNMFVFTVFLLDYFVFCEFQIVSTIHYNQIIIIELCDYFCLHLLVVFQVTPKVVVLGIVMHAIRPP